jgi:hypothetical protein
VSGDIEAARIPVATVRKTNPRVFDRDVIDSAFRFGKTSHSTRFVRLLTFEWRATQRRLFAAGTKVVGRIQVCVTQKLESIAVKLIGSSQRTRLCAIPSTALPAMLKFQMGPDGRGCLYPKRSRHLILKILRQ